MNKAKVRGMKRKCREMIGRIEKGTKTFPNPHHKMDYWHLHLPLSQDFIDSQRTPFSVRRLCVQTCINRAHHLSLIAPVIRKTRVVVAIFLPQIWQSQIIVFFEEDYFSTFFNRNTAAQRWIPIESTCLSKRWSLVLPSGFSEQGYREERNDADGFYSSEVWFIGQLG